MPLTTGRNSLCRATQPRLSRRPDQFAKRTFITPPPIPHDNDFKFEVDRLLITSQVIEKICGILASLATQGLTRPINKINYFFYSCIHLPFSGGFSNEMLKSHIEQVLFSSTADRHKGIYIRDGHNGHNYFPFVYIYFA